MTEVTIGGYAILRQICSTATSELFVARDARRRQDVALKVLLPEAVKDKRALRHMAREAEVGMRLEHRNVVEVYRFEPKAERPYLVMRLVRGETLKKTIYRQRELVVKKGFAWVVRAAQGLQHMHERGFVHLDVKPENILVHEGGQATVIDLALARAIGRTGFFSSLKTRLTGETAGTRSYMSPEQIENRDLTPSADIYSLGIVIFEMFARRLPLTATNPDTILQLHLKSTPPMLHQVVPQIHPELSRLVARMLEKDPIARPRRMEAVIDALARIRRPMSDGTSGK